MQSPLTVPSGVVAPVQPRCTLTPVFTRDPPIFNTDTGAIPPALDALFVPLPPAAAANMHVAVCVPFYSESGFTLTRTLQALAMQRADLHRYYTVARSVPQAALPELHVFAIADGWKKSSE